MKLSEAIIGLEAAESAEEALQYFNKARDSLYTMIAMKLIIIAKKQRYMEIDNGIHKD